MKKLLLCLFATVMTSAFCFGQKAVKLTSIVSESEFKEMDEMDQKIVSYIDAGIFALKGMNLNKESKKKIAFITLSLKEDKLADKLVLEDQVSEPPLDAQSCMICDMISGFQCSRKIRESLGHGPIIVRIELVSDCFSLSWY